MEQFIEVDRIEELINVFGSFDENVRKVESEFDVKIVNRGDELKITGEEENVDLARRVVEHLISMASRGESISEQQVAYVSAQVRDGNDKELSALGKDCVCITARGKPIKAKTLGQKSYIELIKKNPVVFSIGPAGTGKTYLAVALAVTAFRNKEVNRIVLTRPAVEAGEKLGFLPGDLHDKVDPYLRPLYDALSDMLGGEAFSKHLERGLIEVAPLAYMRGRTLDDAFIILDEAQNTTSEQMKMFLTRMGFSSKVVVTGDVTQIDLPADKKSGLKEAEVVLKNIEGISFSYLTDRDVVRHPLVQKIVKAYDRFALDRKRAEQKRNRRNIN